MFFEFSTENDQRFSSKNKTQPIYLKRQLFDAVFHADSEYDVYIALKTTFDSENLDLPAELGSAVA